MDSFPNFSDQENDGKQQFFCRANCASCHSATPSDEVFTVAPGGVRLDTLAEMRQWAVRIKARTVDTSDMPFMNKTEMTDEERALVGRWVVEGTP